MRTYIIIVVCLLILPQSMVSQDKKLLKAAQKGNVASQILLGNFYLGRGMNGDKEQAVQWYRQAAEKDNDRGQYMLGYCYENGIGVKRDSIIAVQWYEKAIMNHNKEAQYALNKLQDRTTVDDEVQKHNIAKPILNIKQAVVKDKAISRPTNNAIDMDIPMTGIEQKNTFAVIIGNEQYMRVSSVPYANNDAKVFAEYCKKTLGLPVQNVRIYENATYGTMLSALADVKKIAEAYNGNINIIFYYAGHGVPNEATKDAFLLPVDADGQQTEACYPVSRLYKELGALRAKNVVVFMDACFSGSQRGDGMLASARGVALKAKAEAPQGNMVVFSAASGDETAFPYKEKGHGMFTYFLLKKLQESKGDCTLQELGEYIQTNVRQQSVVVNRKSQTPTVVPSAGIRESWKTMKLK